MKTRRTFIKGLFGFIGTCLIAMGHKAIPKEKKESNIDWKYYIESLHYPQRQLHQGMIHQIDYKRKIILICDLDD